MCLDMTEKKKLHKVERKNILLRKLDIMIMQFYMMI